MNVIAKKYHVLKTLGQGAMGEVYLVLPPKGDPVALKLLKALDPKSNKEAMEQFENEFRVLKRLSHPHIGRIYDYGYDEELQKVFFTLPWLKGTDIYKATENLDFKKCEEFFVQMFRALNHLHQKDLIHCDLKPGNVYIENNQVLLIDFGLAGYWGENIVGTPTYLAPEVFRTGRHTVASDLYAAGVIMYNCLTRNQPFSGKALQEVYDRHRSYTAPSISEINPNVSKYLSDIVQTLLNKKPDERFPSAASVIEEIDAYSENSYPVETEATLLSYLPTESDVIGKQEAVEDANIALKDFRSPHVPEPFHLILVHGQKNVGKSRLVAKIKNDLQLKKISVENITTPIGERDREVILPAKALILENLDNYFISATEMINFRQILGLLEQKILSPGTEKFLLIASSAAERDFSTVKKLFPAEDARISVIELKPYTHRETHDFLKRIIGQQEIPENFVDQFYRNTGGLPGIATQLIQSMIEHGQLFDASGRWNEDLLTSLNRAFDSLQISESLEQEFEKIYNSLSGEEEEVIKWLSLCPHLLQDSQMGKLVKNHLLQKTLDALVEKNIIRPDGQGYVMSRSVFQNFVNQNLPDGEKRKRHTLLAHPRVELDKKWAVYHLSQGVNPELRLKAIQKLAKIYEIEGEREKAVQAHLSLIAEFKTAPLSERLKWTIEASSLQIWLDRFQDAVQTITQIEREIHQKKPVLDHHQFMGLMENKGKALLHLQKMDKARLYFEAGLKFAQKFNDSKVRQIKFENFLAEIEFVSGRQDEAIKTFKRTRELSSNLSNTEIASITNNDLGHVYLNLHEYDLSLACLKEDIMVLSRLQNREPLARALYSYAEALQSKRCHDKAVAAYEECVVICKQGHYYPLLLRSYNGLGNLYLAQGKNEEAFRNYQKAVDIAVRLKETTSKAALLYNQGFIYRKQNNHALATRRYLMAKQVLESKETKLLAFEESLLSRCLNELTLIAVDENNSMRAIAHKLEQLKLAEGLKTLQSEQFQVRLDLAELYLKNRLKEQFQNEIKTLEQMVTDAEGREHINKLKQLWHELEENADQDATGKISL